MLSRSGPAPDLVLTYGDAPEQVIEVWLRPARAGHRPVVALVHGGFWRPEYDRRHIRPMAGALRDAGWSVASVEYRRVPGRPDRASTDVQAALRGLPALHPPAAEGLIVVGHSAGGHLALLAGVHVPGLYGIIGLAPVASLQLAHRLDLDDGAVADFLGGGPEPRPDLDPVRSADARCPVTIVHGTDDALVPIALAEAYVDAHPATRLVRLERVGHFALIDPLSPAFPAVSAEVARLIT
ncbi:MAG TPA: alpha/beta hydrolase [Jiangellaceae bacterium]|nr:alpha/beta hydrolase [Jiangellaceae bacterium]